ncbi:hypothetical protein MLD38_031367 [Melastoma candidum]|uniref:Uncharacterized protein n=1 Tax=Melastoma candidum TaxID=119954 RepID=A0ACB9MPG0_9MYRT|nr:hypothetical protein MLD38_031367 [Melastoma candidum]
MILCLTWISDFLEECDVAAVECRLGANEIDRRDWKFGRMMKLSGLQFSEKQLLKILQGLGWKGHWKQALSAVEWVYDYKVRLKWLMCLLLGQDDYYLYPDMAAYHPIDVTLGQVGLVRELIKLIECLKQKPTGKTNHFRRKNRDPVLNPDLVVFNAVRKGVFWVFEHLRKNGIRPMEGKLWVGNGEDAISEFGIRRSSLTGDAASRNEEVARAITYKILVKCFSEEGRIDEAVETLRKMEKKGIIGTAGLYYKLACCLCSNGRREQARAELYRTKPLAVTFTSMIVSAMEGGHLDDCSSSFNCMKGLCPPNIGTRVYLQNDMFSKAKELFEKQKQSRASLKLEYFEYVYKAMALSGYWLNQSKQASLLLAACLERCLTSRGHLLECAFDNLINLIDAGGVPCPEIFFEMVIQAMIHHNIEKAVLSVELARVSSKPTGSSIYVQNNRGNESKEPI